MDALYFFLGYLLACLSGYGWFIVGRKTKYQDLNVPPPPNPIELPKIIPEKTKQPIGWVDDYNDPSMANYRPEGEL